MSRNKASESQEKFGNIKVKGFGNSQFLSPD
jgi:hypothetical protein